jgi:hypothetical protein
MSGEGRTRKATLRSEFGSSDGVGDDGTQFVKFIITISIIFDGRNILRCVKR